MHAYKHSVKQTCQIHPRVQEWVFGSFWIPTVCVLTFEWSTNNQSMGTVLEIHINTHTYIYYRHNSSICWHLTYVFSTETVCLAGDWTPTACTEVRSATTIANASQPVNIANSTLFVCRHCRPFLSVHFGISWVKKGRFGPFGPPHLSALFICKYWWTKRADSALFVCRKIVCPFCLPILVCPFCV